MLQEEGPGVAGPRLFGGAVGRGVGCQIPGSGAGGGYGGSIEAGSNPSPARSARSSAALAVPAATPWSLAGPSGMRSSVAASAASSPSAPAGINPASEVWTAEASAASWKSGECGPDLRARAADSQLIAQVRSPVSWASGPPAAMVAAVASYHSRTTSPPREEAGGAAPAVTVVSAATAAVTTVHSGVRGRRAVRGKAAESVVISVRVPLWTSRKIGMPRDGAQV